MSKQIRQNIVDIFGKKSTKAIYDKWVGKNLTGLGGYFKDNDITNASPMDAALATLNLAQGQGADGKTPEDRMKDFSSGINQSLNNLAFTGVDLSNLTNLSPGNLTYTDSVWNNLSLQPNWTDTLNIGKVQPETSIANLKKSFANWDSFNGPLTIGSEVPQPAFMNLPTAQEALGPDIQGELRIEALEQMTGLDLSNVDLQGPIDAEILSDDWGRLKTDPDFGVPPFLSLGIGGYTGPTVSGPSIFIDPGVNPFYTPNP